MAALRTFFLVSSASLFLAVASNSPESSGCVAFENIAARKGTRCGNDGNPCTMVDCSSGVDKYINRPDNTPCTLRKNNGLCSAGQCKLACAGDPSTCKCTVDAHCPSATACKKWKCDIEAGLCEGTPFQNDDMLKAEEEDGDCRKAVCNAQGAMERIPDDTDPKPADEECKLKTCSNGLSMATDVIFGTACSTGVCDGKGTCVDCLSRVDWNVCGGVNCPVRVCLGETCEPGAPDECSSGHCADGFCCNEACTGECMSCELAGSKGTCKNVPYYDDDPQYAAGAEQCEASQGLTCNGEGKCLGMITRSCAVGTQCISSMCESSVCLGAAGEPCNKNSACESGICSTHCKGLKYDVCYNDSDCDSGVCNMDCNDGVCSERGLCG